eukprot:CAMPEP_0185292514 /NCGR_PEP_ID=MMETSP1363-20130426/6135_1 /TAXON_ID=38817 /ORGANISM="Gephyrocapsa oceanica, Strain RCC1303" /LENGTH=101 /DNA_ID=CAMNT_0027888775 /DNA_START=396 /DNA_END=702 /DNA_ORIENTATION=-
MAAWRERARAVKRTVPRIIRPPPGGTRGLLDGRRGVCDVSGGRQPAVHDAPARPQPAEAGDELLAARAGAAHSPVPVLAAGQVVQLGGRGGNWTNVAAMAL